MDSHALLRRSRRWRLRTRTLSWDRAPLVMGIVNVTPDSFSDGGSHFRTDAAVAHGLELVRQGADILDVGGESTRPYSDPVAPEEEWRRVGDVIAGLQAATPTPISIDTSKAIVARRAVEQGVEIINDVTGLTGDPAMLPTAVETGAAVCAMHMQGTPQTMQDAPSYQDVSREVRDYLRSRRDDLVAAGVEADRISLDPGIGFGKKQRHNLELLQTCHLLHELGCPLLLGPSRKGFIGRVLENDQADRTAGTVGVVLSLAAQGVQIVRVHDVAACRQALQLFEASGGLRHLPSALKRD